MVAVTVKVLPFVSWRLGYTMHGILANPGTDAGRYRSVLTLSVVPSVTNRIAPLSRVVITRASGTYRPRTSSVSACGCPKRLSAPTEITATDGCTRSMNSRDDDDRLPW